MEIILDEDCMMSNEYVDKAKGGLKEEKQKKIFLLNLSYFIYHLKCL